MSAKIVINISGENVELSPVEARRIHEQLSEVFECAEAFTNWSDFFPEAHKSEFAYVAQNIE